MEYEKLFLEIFLLKLTENYIFEDCFILGIVFRGPKDIKKIC